MSSSIGYQTAELGPQLHTPAPPFKLVNAQGDNTHLQDLMGERGVLLAFVRNIWAPASIRRILYMQRHFNKFQQSGYNVALIIQDKQYSLWTFYMSSPMSVIVPLLADENGAVHTAYNMDHAGLVLLDKNRIARSKWLMPDERVWPKAREVLQEADTV
jgi:peroxiredoxin